MVEKRKGVLVDVNYMFFFRALNFACVLLGWILHFTFIGRAFSKPKMKRAAWRRALWWTYICITHVNNRRALTLNFQHHDQRTAPNKMTTMVEGCDRTRR